MCVFMYPCAKVMKLEKELPGDGRHGRGGKRGSWDTCDMKQIGRGLGEGMELARKGQDGAGKCTE